MKKGRNMDRKAILAIMFEVIKGEITTEFLSKTITEKIEMEMVDLHSWVHKFEGGVIDIYAVPKDIREIVKYIHEKNQEKVELANSYEFNETHDIESFPFLEESERRFIRDQRVNENFKKLERELEDVKKEINSMKLEISVFKERYFLMEKLSDRKKWKMNLYEPDPRERNLDSILDEDYITVQKISWRELNRMKKIEKIERGFNPFRLETNNFIFWEALDEFNSDPERAVAKARRALKIRERTNMKLIVSQSETVRVWEKCSNLSPKRSPKEVNKIKEMEAKKIESVIVFREKQKKREEKKKNRRKKKN